MIIRSTLLALGAAVLLGACQQNPQEKKEAASVPLATAADVRGEKAGGLYPVMAADKTALDAYVAKPESVYGWKLDSSFQGEGYTAYVLKLTSQTWRKPTEVDRPVWTHWLTIIKPTDVRSDKALLYIGGGSNTNPAPTKAEARDLRIALATHSVVANLGMVPNQPLYFSDSKDVAREEDDLIAYSRVQHFLTKDDEWLVRLAMVKSGVKAMDAVSEFMASDAGGKLPIRQYVVTGGSKRGWTTWLVGAVDTRVIAIAPMVIDALNSEEITKHQFEAYGAFGDALGDYVRHGLFPHRIDTPAYRAVLEIEDPFNYLGRARLTNIPKFEINASGDQFFLPDNSQFYYEKIQGEKRIRYVENSKHNLADTDAVESLLAFYQSVITGGKRPNYSWTKAADGALTVRTDTKPREVRMWQAHDDKARDFRVDTIGKAYTSTLLKPEKDGSYVARLETPAQGFSAFFVELVWDSGGAAPFEFTTPVSITPDVLPYHWSDAAAKYADTIHNADHAAEPRPQKKNEPATQPAAEPSPPGLEPRPMIVGGYGPGDLKDAETAKARTVAVAALKKKFAKAGAIEKTSVESQVVAGMNYRFRFETKGGRVYEVVVYAPLKGAMTATSVGHAN